MFSSCVTNQLGIREDSVIWTFSTLGTLARTSTDITAYVMPWRLAGTLTLLPASGTVGTLRGLSHLNVRCTLGTRVISASDTLGTSKRLELACQWSTPDDPDSDCDDLCKAPLRSLYTTRKARLVADVTPSPVAGGSTEISTRYGRGCQWFVHRPASLAHIRKVPMA